MAKRDWSDLLSPVLVKEIRQYFHSRIMHGITWCLLGGQLVALLAVRGGGTGTGREVTFNSELMFILINLCIIGSGVMICGFIGERRLSAERADSELDFSRITPLSPFHIILGKMAGALVMACYLYALCLPFIVIAYFLRGLEMGVMLLIEALIFPGILLAAQVGLLFGTAGKSRMVWSYAGAIWVIIWFYAAGFIMFGSRGGGTLANNALLMTLMVSGIIGLIFSICVAAINHPAANRMLPVRIYLLLIFLGGPGLGWTAAAALRLSGWHEAVFGSAMICGVLAVVGCAVLAAFERDSAGWRVTRNCPRNYWGRRFYFLLSSGWGGGILLAWFMLLALGILLFCAEKFQLPAKGLMRAGEWGLWLAFYFIGTSELAILLRLWVRKLEDWHWWLIVQGMCLAVLYCLTAASESSPQGFLGVFGINMLKHRDPALVAICGIFAFAGLLLLGKQIRRRFADFHRDARPGTVVSAAKVFSAPAASAAKPAPGPVSPAVLPGAKTKDGWNCWTLLCLRQLRHNKYLWLSGGAIILLQIWFGIDIGKTSSDTYWITELHERMVTFWVLLGGAVIICLTRTFALNRTARQKESVMTHFTDYSPREPGQLLRGLMFSHAVIFAIFTVVASGLLLYAVSLRTEILGSLFFRGIHIYLITLCFGLLFSAGKIRMDTLFCWILLFSLVFLLKEVWGSYLVFIAITLYLMEWFHHSRLFSANRTEVRLRAGQALLLLIAWWMSRLHPDRELLAAIPAMIGAFGAIGSMEECFNPVLRRRPETRKLFSWGWLWAWLAAGSAWLILKKIACDEWGGVIVAALFGGELAFLIGRRSNWAGRYWKKINWENFYTGLSIVFTLGLLLVFLLGGLFELNFDMLLKEWGRVGWGASALLLPGIVPALIRDLRSYLRRRPE